MAITAEAREEIIAVFIGMFNAAPGATYLTQMVTAYEAGVSTLQIAEILSTKIQFTALWGSKTNDEIADQLVANLLSEIPQGAQDWSHNWIVTNLASGMSVPEVIHAAILAIRATDNPNYALAKAALDNEVEVASYFSLLPPQGLGLNGTTLAELQAVIAGVTSDPATVDAAKDNIVNPPVESATFTLTTGQDDFTGGNAIDTFLATQATLQLGDQMDGGDGVDTLRLSISGNSAGTFDGFGTTSVEVIEVKSLSGVDSVLDLSDVDIAGLNGDGELTLRSNETDGASLTFIDIQDMNNTNIEIIDTDEDHTFIYDANAYDPAAADVIDVTLQEMRDTFGGEGYGADITFLDLNGTYSNANVVNLVSGDDEAAGPTPSTANYVDSFRVGDDFQEFNITGNADLEIEDVLDVNVRSINAAGLAADLTLDVNTNASNWAIWAGPGQTRDAFDAPTADETFSYVGAQGDDNLDVIRNGNGTYHLDGLAEDGPDADGIADGSGDDNLQIWGDGNQIITGGAGDDSVGIVASGYDNNGFGDGVHNISLGEGHDFLFIEGDVDDYNVENDGTPSPELDVTTINAGAGNDGIQIEGNGNYDVELEDGDDFFGVGGHPGADYSGTWTVDAGAGDDEVEIWAAKGYVEANLGAGDDLLISSTDFSALDQVDETAPDANGHFVIAGDGDDDVYLLGHGDHTVTGDAGNDVVLIGSLKDTDSCDDDAYALVPHDILVHGVHDINLGDGDDVLLINGARVGTGNLDNTGNDAATLVDAGAGNDLVRVTLDHILSVELGDGNDTLDLRAQDLTVDDSLEGGAGNDDTLILRNEGGSIFTGRVLASETVNTTGFETYDLHDSGIFLKLTDGIIESAENMEFTVSTKHSVQVDLPAFEQDGIEAPVYPFYNNMSKAAFEAAVLLWRNGEYEEVRDYLSLDKDGVYDHYEFMGDDSDELDAARADLIDYLELQGFDVQVTEMGNVNSDDEGYSSSRYFFIEETGEQTIDITDITTPQYNFTLDGGNVRDILIADDDSINSRHTLNFDNDGQGTDCELAGANSIQDTLRVMNGAEITSSDLRNVTGLEIIELIADSNVGQEWHIELTDEVINQTTSEADLIIRVDDNVPAGSALYITLDPSVLDATSNVIIERNAAISVYVRKPGPGEQYELVTEPELGAYFDFGYAGLFIETRLYFTEESGDNLQGTSGDDEFVARSLAHIQTGDNAEGGDHVDGDTLTALFAVNNPSTSLLDIFENANIDEIEHLIFDTENNVRFNGIGIGYMSDLESVTTGTGNDELDNMRKGLEYNLNDGNDYLSLFGFGSDETTINGGAGSDTVDGSSSDDAIEISLVEFVDAGGGSGDTVDIEETGSNALDGKITIKNAESIEGTSGDDNIYADHDSSGTIWLDAEGGDDIIQVGNATPGAATVWGGDGSDSLTVRAAFFAAVYGDDGDSQESSDGSDTISVTVGSGSGSGEALVDGMGGADTITVWAAQEATVLGGGGGDLISVSAGFFADVDGEDGADTITVDGTSGNSLDYADVDGGDGDDRITVTANDADVWGGAGDDIIVVTATDATVDGGAGNDSITVTISAEASLVGGDGADTITVNSTGSGDTSTITGGSGDDVINLIGNDDGTDLLLFGDIDYNASQQLLANSQGTDTINGFNFESQQFPGDPSLTAQDYMDFSAFLGTSVSGLNIIAGQTWASGDTVDANNGAGNSLIVLSAIASPALTSAHFTTGIAGTIQLNDNGKAVVVVGINGTEFGTGISKFEIYYVQDVDTGISGQTWVVTPVATVNAATAIGVGSVVDNIVAGLSTTPNGINVGLNGQTVDLDTGNQTVKLFGEFANNEGPGNEIDDFDSGAGVGDVLDLSAFTWLTGGMERSGGVNGNDGGPFSGSISEFDDNDDEQIDINGVLVLVDTGPGAVSRTEIFDLFGGNPDDPFSISAGGKALVLAGDDDPGDDLYLWFVHDVNGNGSISNDTTEIKLVAVLTDTSSGIDGFHANDFIFA